MTSLKSQILEYFRLRPFEWIVGARLELLAMTEFCDDEGKHFSGSNANRRLRELMHPDWLLELHPEWRITPCKGCSRGELSHRENEKGQTEYMYNSVMNQIAAKKEPTPSESREESKQSAFI